MTVHISNNTQITTTFVKLVRACTPGTRHVGSIVLYVRTGRNISYGYRSLMAVIAPDVQNTQKHEFVAMLLLCGRIRPYCYG